MSIVLIQNDKHLGKFLHIIRDSPVYPVIYDSQRRVLSLPPIINGDLSKISVNTTDVFIECTATDQTKLEIVINMMVAMFSMHTSEPFTYPFCFHSNSVSSPYKSTRGTTTAHDSLRMSRRAR
jgi:phenylalanyl-tRNA synthetase beta subunit